MYRQTFKKISPNEKESLHTAFDVLFPGSQERREQFCDYTLRINNPQTILKQYTNGTLYFETESEEIYNQLQKTIASIVDDKDSCQPVRERQNIGLVDMLPEGVNSWIGSDECGKGDYFGPLVTAAVLVDPKSIMLLNKLHVRDSKTISDNQIEVLASDIRGICDGKYSVVLTMSEEYNELMEGKSIGGNSLKLLGWQHARAIENILENNQGIKYALIDKFSNEKFVRDCLTESGKSLTLIFRHKAESNIAVAAASILARQEFLQRLQELEKLVGMPLPKGASDIVDRAGIKLVGAQGEAVLRKVAKVHFKTTNKILKGRNWIR